MESLEVLFFGMEKHNLFERMIDFTESLSIRNCKVLSNFSQEMFSYRKSCTKLTLHLFHISFSEAFKFL